MTRKTRTIPGPWTRLSLLGILLIAFALRAYQIGDQEISGDEAFSYFFNLSSFQQIIQNTIDLGERNPPDGFLMLKEWMNVAGHSEFALRFVGLWFGVLAVALLYRLGRQLRLPARTAMLAAGLLALSPFAVAYSQSPRAYSASLALGIASTALALAVLNQKW
jgi:predicted membrane-bound mannosyltransferase